jgi:hypothetical protein
MADTVTANTTQATTADLFREEAGRARRYAAAMTDAAVIEKLAGIARIYEELAAAQMPGPNDRD